MNLPSSPLSQWDEFITRNPKIKFIWVQFTTYIGTTLIRMLPVASFIDLLKSNKTITVSRTVLHVLPHDHVAEGGSPVGSFYLKPDLSSLHTRPDGELSRAVVTPWWVDQHGQPIGQCARSKLQSLADQIKTHSGFTVRIGFEVEVVLLKQTQSQHPRSFKHEHLQPASTDHSWSSMTPEDETHLPLLEEIADALSQMGIHLQQFHAEIAAGQWEFVLPPNTPVRAVDHLMAARRTIMGAARRYSLHATLHPRPFPGGFGTGAHVHVSLGREDIDEDANADTHLRRTEPFFAGILETFPAIAAFTLPHAISYSRVAAGIFSGGIYCAWGWDNREVPLRRISTNHFEMKMMDGLGNPYLALCAVLGGGIEGLVRGWALRGGDCGVSPSEMSEGERGWLGVRRRIPGCLEESLDALERSEALVKYLGEPMVLTYLAVKRAELKELKEWECGGWPCLDHVALLMSGLSLDIKKADWWVSEYVTTLPF